MISSLQMVTADTPSALGKSKPVIRHSTPIPLRVLAPLSDRIVLDALARTKSVVRPHTAIP